MDDFKVLTSKEEKDVKDLCSYYLQLREFLANNKYADRTEFGVKIKSKLNVLIKKILSKILKYEVIVDGLENVPSGPVIYASSHQEFNDVINSIFANPEHCLTLNASNVSVFLKMLLGINGVVFVDRDSKESRASAKLEMQRALAKGKSINMYPEATWNCTPSKLHLPFYIGMIDIAKRMGVPVIPVVQEYSYDETIMDGKSHVKSVHIRFCKPVYVDVYDDEMLKLGEFEENFSTARWQLIEEKGLFSRKELSNKLYTDYIKARINDWKIPGNDIIEERKQVFGSSNDIYSFIHINDVEFDSDDNFLPTEHVRQLALINQQHLR